ncbi:MAG TPA: NAD(P)-dependent oxidoreductase [Crinalium sp.]|jgi:3-hydroxyisobutyrate dehydrogenase-like beta-hydroxyacid dehydrogenase
MNTNIGFVGLGSMGLPMATNLIKAGYKLRVYNRTADKARSLVEQGAELVEHPADAVEPGGIVVSMVSNDQVLESVTLGENGILSRLGADGVHLAMSTVAPATTRTLAQQHEQIGAHYLAAPVFGRPDAAAAAKLWICVSGKPEIKQRVRPLLDALGQGVFDFGDEVGNANVVKLAGNFLILSAIEAMSEAYTLAEKNGIDRQQIADLFGQTLFACPIYQNYGRMVAQEKLEPVGFKLSLGLKDATLALQTAQESQMPMPLASLVRDRLLSALAKGRGEVDWAGGMALGVSEDAGL